SSMGFPESSTSSSVVISPPLTFKPTPVRGDQDSLSTVLTFSDINVSPCDYLVLDLVEHALVLLRRVRDLALGYLLLVERGLEPRVGRTLLRREYHRAFRGHVHAHIEHEILHAFLLRDLTGHQPCKVCGPYVPLGRPLVLLGEVRSADR